MIVQKKQIIVFILLGINIISYGQMIHPTLTQRIAYPLQSFIAKIHSYYNATPTPPFICHLKIDNELNYSSINTEIFKKECVAKKISAEINAQCLHVSDNHYFYNPQVILYSRYQLWRMTQENAMEQLNSIEKDLKSLLQHNGYSSWNDTLIDEVRKNNVYFNGLIETIIATQTRWQDLKASTIDNFFRWKNISLKTSVIGLYVHLKIMNQYADEHNLAKDEHNLPKNELLLAKHMLLRIISNVQDDIDELKLLSKTKICKQIKDNFAIREAAQSRIDALQKLNEQKEQEKQQERKLRDGL